jgi:hypothetical protein
MAGKVVFLTLVVALFALGASETYAAKKVEKKVADVVTEAKAEV